MPTVSNNDLMVELKSIQETYEDKFLKLNKYLISRCLHFEEQTRILTAESQAMKNELDNMKSKYDSICEEVQSTKAEVNCLKYQILEKNAVIECKTETEDSNLIASNNITVINSNSLESTITGIRDDVFSVKEEINTLKQNTMNNDIVITGIEEVFNENLFEKVNEVLVQYNATINKSDIKKLYRLKSKNSSKNTPILIVFKENLFKQLILEQQKKCGPILLQSVYKDLPKTDLTKVYFKHRLTKENLLLLKESRKFARENDFKFVWTNSAATILLKKNSESRTIQVTSLKFLQSL